MNRIVISSGLAAATLLAADQFLRMQERLDELGSAPNVPPAHVARLEREVSQLREQLFEARRRLEDDERARQLEDRLAVIASRVERSDFEIAEQDARLESWESLWRGYAPQRIDGSLSQLRELVRAKDSRIADLDERAQRVEAQTQARIASLDSRVAPLVERDVERMWRELVAPVVQLAGDATVGSGVLLESIPDDDGEGWTTHLLTSWHVVRDIYGAPQRTQDPVPVTMFERNGATRRERALMVAYDVQLDIAVLELQSDERLAFGARLAPRSRLENVRVFDAIYAVGCPLGNDPIPTPGEIASTTHVVDGVRYWMLSAPTYIGNSGGGIFDARTHELVGIFSKIYTHGAARSTIVPHMGLATPMPVVYDWMERAGCARLVRDDQARPEAASAKQ